MTKMPMMSLSFILALVATIKAHPSYDKHFLSKRTLNGIATFNDYQGQGNTNCGPTTGDYRLHPTWYSTP